MAQNKYAKYVDLLSFVRNRKPTLKEIMDYWEDSYDENLSTRTFHRYREAVSDIFGLEIKCDKSTYRYYLEDLDELQNSLQAWLLDSYTAFNQVKADEKLAGRVIYEEVPSGSHFLQALIDAIRKNQGVRILYHKFSSKQAEERDIFPYFLRLYKRRWYVIALSRHASEIRTYALDRIKELSPIDEHFQIPEDFDSYEYFNDTFGIMGAPKGVETQEILIKAEGETRLYLETLPLHPTQIIIDKGDDYTIFRYFLKPNFNFTQELLSQATRIEVLSPLSYREEIKKTIEKMGSKYKEG